MFAVFFPAVGCWDGCEFSLGSAWGREVEMQLRWVMIIQSLGRFKSRLW